MTLDDAVFVKLFRRLEEGIHPEVELHRGLSSSEGSVASRLFGACVYYSPGKSPCYFATFAEHFQHSKTLWFIAIDSVSMYLEEAMAANISGPSAAPPSDISPQDHLYFAKKARIIGGLTAKMHQTFLHKDSPEFQPEPFSSLYQRSLYQSFRNLTHRIFSVIEERIVLFPPAMIPDIKNLLQNEKNIITALTAILRTKISAMRMRVHGDLHLGQIMVMDDRFRICDFEGLPTMPLSERRIKRSLLRDVASMIHSLHHAAYFSLLNNVKIQEKDRQSLLPVAHQWADAMGQAFLSGYNDFVKDEPGLAIASRESRGLLPMYLFECALNEIEISIESKPENLFVIAQCLLHYINEGPHAVV
jgi:maltose alpha-D-glucosyltransferase/alpha-amylase